MDDLRSPLVPIREASAPDREAIIRIARASFDRVYAFFAVRGLGRADPLLVAEDGGAVMGFLEGIVFPGAPPIGYVYFVAVDPSRRGRGTGRTLVAGAIERFRAAGATRAFAAVPKDNDASRRLFESLGFREAPRSALRRWYGWRGITAQMRMVLAPHEVLMARTFTDPSPASVQEAPGPSS